MTNAGTPPDLASLEPLEPLDAGGTEAGPGAPAGDAALVQTLRSGLPCPGFNPYCGDKTYYRFLFAGVMMLLGCLMPFGADTAVAGYQTMSGAVYTLIAIGMIWTWWGAIHTNRSTGASLKWLLLCLAPLVAIVMNMTAFVPAESFDVAKARGWLASDAAFSSGWKELFKDVGSALMKDAAAAEKVGNFWRLFGTGQFFVFLGAVFAELGFVGGVIGGARKNKQEKQARMMAAAERRRK
ncbi:MAG: hypothetical protein FJ265_02910 [Planctomycetes bacterium]|nr:hypothetical protein [Planctomycetota bacterium]